MATDPLQSVTGYATDVLRNWRNEAVRQAQSANESSTLIKIASEGGFLLLSLAGTVETVFRSFLLLSVGGIWLCLPQQWAADWKANYGAPAMENAIVTFCYTMVNVVTLFDNFNENNLSINKILDNWAKSINIGSALNNLNANGWMRL